ncbi:hypothetical protein ACFQZC_02355 [Streptacidiphilus monticola]
MQRAEQGGGSVPGQELGLASDLGLDDGLRPGPVGSEGQLPVASQFRCGPGGEVFAALLQQRAGGWGELTGSQAAGRAPAVQRLQFRRHAFGRCGGDLGELLLDGGRGAFGVGTEEVRDVAAVFDGEGLQQRQPLPAQHAAGPGEPGFGVGTGLVAPGEQGRDHFVQW